MSDFEAFEQALERAMGPDIRKQTVVAEQVWSALANIVWRHGNKHEVSYSFRDAGDLIAEIRGEGDYLDWYCCAEAGTVSKLVSQAMEKEGWAWGEHPL